MRRLYLRILRQQNITAVRKLEMTVDELDVEPGHKIQFWIDFAVYGLREAIMYLEQVTDVQQLKVEANGILESLGYSKCR